LKNYDKLLCHDIVSCLNGVLTREYDAMSGDMALFFNGVADNSPFISVPHRDDKPIATKHKDFYIVMCGNTWGKGSSEYSGRDFQDKALMDRFRLCKHFIGYHVPLEKHLMGSNYAFSQRLRTELEACGSYLSTRNIEDISLALHSMSLETIFDLLIEDLESIDKENLMKKKNEIINGANTPKAASKDKSNKTKITSSDVESTIIPDYSFEQLLQQINREDD